MSNLFTNDAFDANLPPPAVGRGHRAVIPTAGRLQHDRRLAQNAAAGRKRAETHHRKLAAAVAAAQSAPPVPVLNTAARHSVTPAPTPSHALLRTTGFGSLPPPTLASVPSTPIRPHPVNPKSINADATPSIRRPLQLVGQNSSPVEYLDFSQVKPSRPSPTSQLTSSLSSFPATSQQSPAGAASDSFSWDWFNTLPPAEQGRLLAYAQTGSSDTSSADNSFDRDSHGSLDAPLQTYLGTENGMALGQNMGHGGDTQQEDYEDPSWASTPPLDSRDEGLDQADDVQEQPVSSLQFTTRTLDISRPEKRKAWHQEPDAVEEEGNEDSSNATTAAATGAKKKLKKKGSRSISALAADHQRICEVAYTYVKIDITCKTPFPVGGRRSTSLSSDNEFSELLLRAWTNAAFDLEMDNVEPTREDLQLLRSRVPQFRAGLRAVARARVPAAYKLQDIGTLPSPTPARVEAAVDENRKRVELILKTFIYKDPDNITPDSMFLNDIFQHVLNVYWFGHKDNNRSSYFKDLTAVDLVTMALIMVAVLCAIEEWTTGRWVEQHFTHSVYSPKYQKILAGLQMWKTHSDKQVREKGALRNLTLEAQQNWLSNARAVSKIPVPVDDGSDDLDAMFSHAAFEANAAVVAPATAQVNVQ